MTLKEFDLVMGSDDELVTEIWVSNNFTSVAFSKVEVRKMADSLPDAMGTNFVLWQKRLKNPKTKREIRHAMPEELKEWIE